MPRQVLKRVSIATFAFVSTSALAQTGTFEGVFKPRGEDFAHWDCKLVGRDGGAVAIENSVLLGVESRCKLNNPVQVNGMSAVLYDAQCASEGYEWKERVMLMSAEWGIYYITDKFVAEWQNCVSQ